MVTVNIYIHNIVIKGGLEEWGGDDVRGGRRTGVAIRGEEDEGEVEN